MKAVIQVLQKELQAMVQMHRDYADHLAALCKTMGSLDPSSIDKVTIEVWDFEENNYSQLVTWLMHDPWALENKCKHPSESWPMYAVRISKYVGWIVDPNTLRQCCLRRMASKK